MRTIPWLVAAGCTLALAACASSLYAPSGGKPPYPRTLSQQGVSPATVDRIARARPLLFPEVLELVQRGIPGNQIVAYMRSTRAPYNYSQAQITALVNAGADNTLINFVGRSSGDFLLDAQNAAQQTSLLRETRLEKSFWDHPYFADPDYLGAPPFGFLWPDVWY